MVAARVFEQGMGLVLAHDWVVSLFPGVNHSLLVVMREHHFVTYVFDVFPFQITIAENLPPHLIFDIKVKPQAKH